MDTAVETPIGHSRMKTWIREWAVLSTLCAVCGFDGRITTASVIAREHAQDAAHRVDRMRGLTNMPDPSSLPRQRHRLPDRGVADSTRLNDFISYDAAKKTVTIQLIAALNSTNGGFNFNGGSNGDQTITVPVGWTVAIDFENHDAVAHSAIVIRDQTPVPTTPDQPAFPKAFTNDLAAGLPPQTGHDTMQFIADAPGSYLFACGVTGHATSGFYIRFVVAATARVPQNAGTIGKKS